MAVPEPSFDAEGRLFCYALTNDLWVIGGAISNGGITLPPGFCAVVVARDVGKARHIAVRPNGDVYVAIDNDPATNMTGGILRWSDEVDPSIPKY